MPGLTLVPTPIGNLNDMSPRCIDALNEADLVLAEDTRVSGRLLKHFSITTPLKSFHLNNEHKVLDHFTDLLEAGKTIALISDAGTPAISDPGFLLVRACVQKDIPVMSIPGPTALIAALVNSGLPTDRFTFEGFLPRKKGRSTRLKELLVEPRTMVFYESPHRIQKTIDQFAEVFGPDRQASISKEISKMFEKTVRGSLSELQKTLTSMSLKGEFVIVLAGKDHK